MERLKTGGVAKFDVKKDRYRLCQPGHWQDEHLVGIMRPPRSHQSTRICTKQLRLIDQFTIHRFEHFSTFTFSNFSFDATEKIKTFVDRLVSTGKIAKRHICALACTYFYAHTFE